VPAARSVLSHIARLLQCDLVRERAKFADGVERVRAAFERETRQTQRASADMWGRHLDRQLYKVLDLQYRRALQHLRTALPDIGADLCFKSRRLELRPAQDQLRKQYYKALKAVLDYPCTFRGLVSSSSSDAGGSASASSAGGRSANAADAPFWLIPARNAAALQARLRGVWRVPAISNF
jgi:hypothetical protein